MSISDEEKETFLALLRAGHAPPEAARMVNAQYTASMFRRLVNENSKAYDPEFAAEYLRARAEYSQQNPHRSEAGKPRTTTLSGHVKAKYLTEEMLEPFLEDVANGVPITKAVKKIMPRTTLSQVNRRAHRDPAFAEKYAQAREEGYPIFKENLRAKTIELALEEGEYRATRDLAIIHLPEFREAFLTRKTEITGGTANEIRVFVQQVLPFIEDEDLNRLIETVEQRQLTAGEDENGSWTN